MKLKTLKGYMRRAEVVAENSPDAQTKVGSILISQSTGSVISEGYNGFIRGADDENIPKTRPDKYFFMCHSEENLLCNSARNGIRTDGCFTVQTLSPCLSCARRLYQAGINTIYYRDYYLGSDEVEISEMQFDIEVLDEGINKLTISPRKNFKLKKQEQG